MTTESAVAQSKGAYHQTEASLADLKRQVRETENSISVLLAKAPQNIERGTLEEQVMPTELAVGVPLQLLENRPDVKAAELALASAYYTTNQARSAFYPGVNITGTLGWTNGSNGTVISNPAVMLWNAIGSLTQPIFQRGTGCQFESVESRRTDCKMNYQQTILEAGKEVSDALFLYDTADKKLTEHQAQVSEMQKAVEMNKDLFQAGKATYLEIITAQQSLLSAQLNEVSDTFQRMQAVINLYSALGGGRE